MVSGVPGRGLRARPAIQAGAFNLGNALGAAVGGAALGLHLGTPAVPVAGALVALAGVLIALAGRSRARRAPTAGG